MLYLARREGLADGGEMPTLIVHFVAGPQGFGHFDRLVEEGVALLEIHPEDQEFRAQVPGAELERGATPGKDVDGGHGLGHQ